jgi:methyl-accepting chemotaxis protein
VAERLERRRADRLAADGLVTLRPASAGPPVRGRVTDLSTGGFGCTVPARTPVAVGDAVQATIELDGFPVPVAATVARRRELDDEIELGLSLTEIGADAQRRLDAHLNQAVETS